jgi:hypothetical protein
MDIQSLFTADAPGKWDVGSVIYRDAQMDTVPMRGAGYRPRDYAGEADVNVTLVGSVTRFWTCYMPSFYVE